MKNRHRGPTSRRLIDREASHWALVDRTDRQNSRLAIFVHGFRGSYLGTWGRLSEHLRLHADADAKLSQWDYMFIGYETATIGNYLKIADIIASQWVNAKGGDFPFAANYSKVALFGHSLGTLGIRQLLCAMAINKQDIQSVTLIGSPLNGSPLAVLKPLVRLRDALRNPKGLLPGGYAITDSLRPSNPQLLMLRRWTDTAHKHTGLSPVQLVLGTDDGVVGTGDPFIDGWTGDMCEVVAHDHFSLISLDGGDNSELMRIIKRGLK